MTDTYLPISDNTPATGVLNNSVPQVATDAAAQQQAPSPFAHIEQEAAAQKDTAIMLGAEELEYLKSLVQRDLATIAAPHPGLTAWVGELRGKIAALHDKLDAAL